jgi:hypothetical protein
VAEGQGNPAEAIRSYQEALEIFAAIGVKDAEFTRADLGRVLRRGGLKTILRWIAGSLLPRRR